MAYSLTNLPLPLRLTMTFALLTLSLGYATAVLNLYFTYSSADGEAGLSTNDLVRSFSSPRGRTLLAAKIDGGSMEQYLVDQLDKARMINWIADGAPRGDYEQTIAPILNSNCISCHNENGLMYLQPLDRYEALEPILRKDRGEPVPVWARVAHTHLQAIGLVFLAVGCIFCATSMPPRWKTIVVVTPFAGLLVDFAARFLARYHSGFVSLMMAAGAAAGASFAFMVAASLFDMWRARYRGVSKGSPHC